MSDNFSGSIDYDDETLWDVCVYGEMDILSNILTALSLYRSRCQERWPRLITVHPKNRLSINLGDDIKIVKKDWTLRDATYLSYYKPYYDPHNNVKTPTVFVGSRQAVADKEKIFFRFRKDF